MAAAISVVVAIGVAVLALVALRNIGRSAAGSHEPPERDREPEDAAAQAVLSAGAAPAAD